MVRAITAIGFMVQCLAACALFGMGMRDKKAYRSPFGKLFLPYDLQIVMSVWLIISLFANVLFAYCM